MNKNEIIEKILDYLFENYYNKLDQSNNYQTKTSLWGKKHPYQLYLFVNNYN